MVTRHSANGFMPISDDGRWVTHADYRALEEELYAARLQRDQAEDKLARVTEELASILTSVAEEDLVGELVSDICELTKADPDDPNTVCVNVDSMIVSIGQTLAASRIPKEQTK